MPDLRRTAISAATALATVVMTALAVPATAHASTSASEVYPVPASGVFNVVGHGWGHGYGMSQWGAAQAAAEGESAASILRFYYPGTTIGTAGSPLIRVALTGTGSGTTSVGYGGTGSYRYQCSDATAPSTGCTLDVVNQPGTVITDSATGRHPDTTAGVVLWRITVAADGLHLAGITGDTVTPHTIGGATAVTGPITVSGQPYVRVSYGHTQRDYRGTISAVRTSTPGTAPARFVRLDTLPLDDYVRGVVFRESLASWPLAALEAQAVAARSYADAARLHSTSLPYDICDSTYCQVFGGTQLISGGTATWLEPSSSDPSRDPVAQTADQVLERGGVPISTMFGASNGGWTTGSGYDNTPQTDPWDAASADPRHDWTATLSAATLAREYGLARLDRLVVTSRDGTSAQWGGRVRSVDLVGVDTAGLPDTVHVTSQDSLRFGMNSTYWRITDFVDQPVTATAPSTVQRGTTFVVQGTAPSGTPVTVYVATPGHSAEPLTPVTADGTGHWATVVFAALDTTTYAVAAGSHTSAVTTRAVGTTITGPATAGLGSTVTLTGYAAPGSSAIVRIRPLTAKVDSMAGRATADSNGRFTFRFPLATASSWYATADGVASAHGTTTPVAALTGPSTAARGSLVTVTGRAFPREAVSLWVLRQGTTAYTRLTTLRADSAGRFTVRLRAMNDTRYYAVTAEGHSATGLVRVTGTTAGGPASAPTGSTVTLAGYAAPRASVAIRIRALGATTWTRLGSTTAAATGRWSHPFVLATTMQWYAVTAGGLASPVGTTRAG